MRAFRLISASVSAACLALLLSGCATSGRFTAVKPALPDIPEKLQQECRDPGVPEIDTVGVAVDTVAATRIYAVCNKEKATGLKTFYRSVQTNFRGK